MHGKVLKGMIWIPYFLPFTAFVVCDFSGIRPPSCWLWWRVPERSPDHGDQINSPPWKGRKGCQCAPRRVSLPHWCYDYSFNRTMSAKWLHWMPSCMKGERCLLKDSDLIGTLILFILFFPSVYCETQMDERQIQWLAGWLISIIHVANVGPFTRLKYGE